MKQFVDEKTGKVRTYLNPAEKAEKYVREVTSGLRETNDRFPKQDEDGVRMRLTAEQRAYRAGYLDHSKDSARAFRSKHPDYVRKTESVAKSKPKKRRNYK